MLQTASLDTRSRPLAATDWDRRYRVLRRALVRRLCLAGSMTIVKRQTVERAARLSVLAERAAMDPAVPVDHVTRIDRSAQRAREAVDRLANRKPSSVSWLRGGK
jgi:hypothetical protein